jgi:Putative zinc-finger
MTMRGREEHPDELISASLTEELSAEDRTQLTAHLAGCRTCRETLDAFEEQRRLVHGARHVDPPRDLKARIDAGIESGRFARAPWWRRPRLLVGTGAAAATVVAGILAVVVLGNLRPTPVAVASESPAVATPSVAASASAELSPSAEPTPAPLIALGTGDIGYFVASGGYTDMPRQLQFVDQTGDASLTIDAGSGPPISAALSPTGEWLAWIDRLGETGAQEVRAVNLSDGTTVSLGCSVSWPFTERLAWSSDGSQLAYTLAGADIGSGIEGCAASSQPSGEVDAWLFNTTTGSHARFTTTGDAYAADFRFGTDVEGGSALLVSHAAARPWTEELRAPGALGPGDGPRADDVFMPLLSADGSRALFWTGTMDQIGGAGGQWVFVGGGLPQISDASADPGTSWPLGASGRALFNDLQAIGGAAFASGSFAWSSDGANVAFWNGSWTGAPQSADGTYPSQADAYVGSADTGLDQTSRVDGLDTGTYVEDVTFEADPNTALVMVAWPSAGIGDAPSADIWRIYLDGSGAPKPVAYGGARNPTPWYGPPVIGQESPAPGS